MSKVDTIYLVRGQGLRGFYVLGLRTYVITRLAKKMIAAVGLEPDPFGSSFSGFPTLVEIDNDSKVTKFSFRMAESN